MPATLIDFPTAHDRSDREFLRTGSTAWTRALDEAEAIGGAMENPSAVRLEISDRIDRLEVVIRQLTTWRDDEMDTEVELPLFGQHATIPLRQAPHFLQSMLRAMSITCPVARPVLTLCREG